MTTRKFTSEEVALVHRTMMEGAKIDDVKLFIATCERTGLDPFARQIMASSRNTNKNGAWVTLWTWLVMIDGLRKIAVDSGDYEGQEGPWWCGKDGAWKEVWTESGPCFAAKVIVHRKGFRVGLSGIAKYDSYVQKKKDGAPNSVWQSLGDHMTAKCAEALALRRAYPNEMAGLYTSDEMAQAEFEAPSEPSKPFQEPAPAVPPSAHIPEPQAPTVRPPAAQSWSIEEQERFEAEMERAYWAHKQLGVEKTNHAPFESKWRANRAKDPASVVIPALQVAVQKRIDAAEKAILAKSVAA